MSAETNFETAVRAALETYDESLPLAPQQRRTDEPGDVTRVTVLNMAGFASRMAGLSRRALRLGLPEIVWRVVSKQRDTIRRYLIDDFGHRTLAGRRCHQQQLHLGRRCVYPRNRGGLRREL